MVGDRLAAGVLLRRRRAGRRRRRHDRGHRHRRAGRPAVAPRTVRADEPPRHRAGADLVASVSRNAWKLPMPRSSKNRRAPAARSLSSWCALRSANGIATLTINRPDAMNALNEEVVGAARDAISPRWPSDPAVKGIVDRGQRQSLRRRRRHPLLRPQHRVRQHRSDRGVHASAARRCCARSRRAPKPVDRPRPRPRARRRRRARARVPRDRRDAEGHARVSRNRHRHLPGPRRHAAHDEARRHRDWRSGWC